MKERLLKLTFFTTALLLSGSAFAFPVMIKKNLVIRSIENGNAVFKGAYVLKAGSVIDIPDEFVVRDSIGDVDLIATLLNWRTQDPKNGIYRIVGKNSQVVSEETFFKLKVIKAAPGSLIPTDFPGYIALDLLARKRELKVVSDPPPEDTSTTASSEPRSSHSKPKLENSKRNESDLTPNSGLYSPPSPGGSTPPPLPSAPSRPSKSEVLRPDTSKSHDDLKIYEGSKLAPSSESIPIPTPRPKMGLVAEALNDASKILPRAGSADAVCPDGKCDVTTAGDDAQEKLVCEQISKGNFPKSLNSIPFNASGQRVLDASFQWISRVLNHPEQCKGSCHFPSKSRLFSWLRLAKSSLNSYCESIKNCASRCKTSEIQPSLKCTNASKKRAAECKKQCSPYLNIDTSHRKDHLKRLFDKISSEVAQEHPEYTRRMKANGIFDNMDQRLLCLNVRRENVELDPMARNCGSSALGIGQVLVGTFYYGFGLANKTQQRNCIDFKLKDLEKKCKGWDKHAFRKEIYGKYMDYTPKELYEMRTLDVELQARASYATFMDKLRLNGFNLNKAYRSYFGKSDSKAINQIESCVRTGK